MKLLDLNDPIWNAYPGAYGSIREEIGVLMGEPAGEQIQLRRLKEPAEDNEHLAFDNLCESLSHQMTFYPAMYIALPYVVKFLGRKSGDYDWKRLIFSEIGQCLATDAFWEGESAPNAPEDILESYREAAGILAGQAERFLSDCRKQLRKEENFERRWLLLGLYGLLGDRREAYVMNMNAWETCYVQCGQCGYLDEDLTLSDTKQRRKLRPVRIWQKQPPQFKRFRKCLHAMGDWEGEELLAWYYGTYTCPECGKRQATMEAMIRAFDPGFQEPEEVPQIKEKPAAPKFSLPKLPFTESKKALKTDGQEMEGPSREEAQKLEISSKPNGQEREGKSREGAKKPEASAKPNGQETETPPGERTQKLEAASKEERKKPEPAKPLPDVLEDNALAHALELCGDYPSVLALAERREFREAAEWCARYLEAAPDWRLHVLRAYCFKALGKTPELDRCLTAALELDPDNVLILRARCPTVSTTNRYRRHIQDLTRLLELDPEHCGSYLVSRAYRNHWTGDDDAARKDLKDALAADSAFCRRSVDFQALWEQFGLPEGDG